VVRFRSPFVLPTAVLVALHLPLSFSSPLPATQRPKNGCVFLLLCNIKYFTMLRILCGARIFNAEGTLHALEVFMYPYLAFLALAFAVPLVPLVWLCRRNLAHYRRTALWSLAFVCTIGAVWDLLSWKTGVWRYDSGRTLGPWLGGLPAEEFIGFYLLGTLLIVCVSLLFISRRRHV
jgi:lycopene cyclase domain-containing protein